MIFRCKQFSVLQEKSAMKIGTDSILLGAWAFVGHFPQKILDVGAGTGILSLMLAQRTDAHTIDAVEIDEDAFIECTENFENSPWNDRLFCYMADFQEFTQEMQGEEFYDLIVSNPPFYTTDYKSPEINRNKARFEDSLPFENLLKNVKLLLHPEGIFAVIIPFLEEENFVKLAAENGLFPQRIMRVKGNETSPQKRSLLCFSTQKTEPIFEELVIETDRHHYTENYKNLTKDFYLNF